jgi:hypothetical protein
MARISEKVKNYASAKGACNTPMNLFDAIQNVLDTLFDIRFAMKKKWGYEWYEYVHDGFYDSARETVLAQAPCFTKTVALKCIDDLEALRAEMNAMEEGGDN